MASKKELQDQLAAIQQQLNSVPEWEIGDEIFTSMGLAKVSQYYQEDGVDKIQLLMTQLDSRDMITLKEHTYLISMPPSNFRRIIKDHQADQQQRELIIQNEATKAEFAEFLRQKAAVKEVAPVETPPSEDV